MWRSLRQRLLGISPEETTCARRGFRPAGADAHRTLERIGQVFLQGYHAALESSEPEALAGRLDAIDRPVRGFAFEGAAMGLSILDHLVPAGRSRWLAFANGPGSPHVYMVHVGVGWVIARLPWLRYRIGHAIGDLDPLLRWLAVDGYGFHEGYFHWPRSVRKQAVPRRLSGYAVHAFDQGLGRSLWFVEGADVNRIPLTIAAFPVSRRADLWSGVGLACAYAGGVDRAAMTRLWTSAADYRAHLAQGAAFAAKARQRAGNLSEHTELACHVFCGVSANVAAAVADVALKNAVPTEADPAYEVWRQHIREQLIRGVAEDAVAT